jgi:protein-disulfide isomerase
MIGGSAAMFYGGRSALRWLGLCALMTLAGCAGGLPGGLSEEGADNSKATAKVADLKNAGPLGEKTMGKPDAPVTIVEYASLGCPICAAFHAQVFAQVKKTYIDTGKVYFSFRMFPISAADGAAEAIARCLPKDQYFSFAEVLFRKQNEWDPEFGVTDVHGALVKLARVAGLGAEQVDRCIQDKSVQQRINQIAEDGEKRFKIEATPTLVIDGVAQEPGAIPWPELQRLIEAALKKKH